MGASKKTWVSNAGFRSPAGKGELEFDSPKLGRFTRADLQGRAFTPLMFTAIPVNCYFILSNVILGGGKPPSHLQLWGLNRLPLGLPITNENCEMTS